jgi:hypothetical protein
VQNRSIGRAESLASDGKNRTFALWSAFFAAAAPAFVGR